jgi:hypothetical protein
VFTRAFSGLYSSLPFGSQNLTKFVEGLLTIQAIRTLTEGLAEELLQGIHHYDGFCSYLGLQWLFRQSEVIESEMTERTNQNKLSVQINKWISFTQ